MTADHPRRTSDFDYVLPPDLIAQVPLPDRSASRMLIVRRQTSLGRASIEDGSFAQLADIIPPGDLLVINTTKVRRGRLLGTRPSGASAEVLLIHPAQGDAWIAMGQPGHALRPGKRIALAPDVSIETISVLPDGHRIVRFHGVSAEEAMERYGRVPLPPYIAREPTAADVTRYQTVYAAREGSVAAPTAGLHFEPVILDRLSARGVTIAGLDLEVGPGTFKPVDTEFVADHAMHPERFEIPASTARSIVETRQRGGQVWAVGTTVVRALESASATGTLTGRQETRLLIVPGYRFSVVDRLLTNFHLPRSTLLMLVSAFAGHDLTREAYRHAVVRRYRFYSYGDAMLVL